MPAGKTIAFVAIPVVLIGGVVGAGLTGVVNIPGLTPKPAKGKAGMYGEAAAMYGEGAAPAPIAEAAPVKPPPPPERPAPRQDAAPATDPEAGAKRLARIWDNVDVPALVAITAEYKVPELALVLSKMDAEKVAELLTAVEPGRAADLSREMQRLASIVRPESEGA